MTVERTTPLLVRAALLLLLLALALPAQAAGDQLLVFAAASLKNAMDDVVTVYESHHDVDIKVSYAGSSTLARQIEQGAPADLYVSANRRWMDQLIQDDLIDRDSRVSLLRNALVLVAPNNSAVKFMIAPGFPIAETLGNGYLALANTDAVPAGIYARQALTALGVWKSLQGHVAQAADVRAALALVARGETPLGVVYASDAVAEKRVRVVDTFPAASHDPIIYPAAILKGADNPRARQFMAFLQSNTAGRIFARWGFQRAPDDQ